MLKEQSQSLDNVEIRLANVMQNIVSGAKQNFQLAATQIYQSSALQKFSKHEDRLKNNLNSLNSQIKNLIDKKKLMLASLNANLKAISPLAVLDRGYAIVMNENGQALKSSKLINKTIEESFIPNGIRIGLVKKNDNIVVPNKDTIIEINDEVVLLSLSESLHKVEELFQVRGAF